MTGNPPSTSASPRSESRGPLRILLAAESAVEQKLATGLLAKHGHRVLVANNGQDAIRECSKNEIDVVILDHWLCEADGADVVREIRLREKSMSRRIPILAMSDDGLEGPPPDGMDGLIEKPLRIDQIIACLESANRTSQNNASLSSPEACPESAPQCEVDWTTALEAVGGRRDLLSELVEIFFTEYPINLAAIRDAIANQDARGLQLYAHKLKGCLRYFGQNEASQLAAELEDMGRQSQLAFASKKLEELIVATNRLLPTLKAGPNF